MPRLTNSASLHTVYALLMRTKCVHALKTWVRAHVVLILTLHLWQKLLVAAEEEEEQIGDYGRQSAVKPSSVGKLTEAQQDYLRNFDTMMVRASSLAKRLRRRFVVSSAISIVSAGAVPVCVAAEAQGWITATLGALAAAVQALQEMLKDQRRGAQWNLGAAALGRARRRMVYDMAKLQTEIERSARFDQFVHEAEDLLATGAPSIGRLETASAS